MLKYSFWFENDKYFTTIQVNDFAAAATDNKISSILSEDKVDALTRIILLNAVYFKGKGRGESIILDYFRNIL